MVFRDATGFASKAGEGRYHGHIQLKGVNKNILDVKVSGKDTNGDLAIFEQTKLSPKRGVPLHIHPHQEEIFVAMAALTTNLPRNKSPVFLRRMI